MYWDQTDYLPNDILTKIDRASMSVSLETRAPILDFRIVEFARSLGDEAYFGQGGGKQILKNILKKYLGNNFKETPKMGFGVPIDKWFRKELYGFTGDLINENMIKQQGLFDYENLQNIWNEHQSGQKNRHHLLWNYIVFQLWYKNFIQEGAN